MKNRLINELMRYQKVEVEEKKEGKNNKKKGGDKKSTIHQAKSL